MRQSGTYMLSEEGYPDFQWPWVRHEKVVIDVRALGAVYIGIGFGRFEAEKSRYNFYYEPNAGDPAISQ